MTETTPFDAANYISNEGEAKRFLLEVERDVPAHLLEDVRTHARETVERAHKRWLDAKGNPT